MNKIVIWNFIKDEKFIDDVVECHDLTTDISEHRYFIVVEKSTISLKYIKRYQNRVELITKSELVNIMITCPPDAVILHSFLSLSAELIAGIPQPVKVLWFSWGFDMYGYPAYKPFVNDSLYESQTLRYLSKDNRHSILGSLKNIIIDYRNSKRVYKALNRVDLYSGVLEYEYDLMKKVPGFRAKPVSYQYNSITNFTSYNKPAVPSSNNIIIGNSASPNNNHLDLLCMMQSLNLKDRSLYIPLSYGWGKEYICEVKKTAYTLFGSNFMPLDSFMPIEQYKSIIYSCNVAIYYHRRQQAIFNINNSLASGCKVFLNEENPVFQFYKKLGLVIFSVQKDLSQESINTPLRYEDAESNRRIIQKRYSQDTYKNNLENIYKLIKQ